MRKHGHDASVAKLIKEITNTKSCPSDKWCKWHGSASSQRSTFLMCGSRVSLRKVAFLPRSRRHLHSSINLFPLADSAKVCARNLEHCGPCDEIHKMFFLQRRRGPLMLWKFLKWCGPVWLGRGILSFFDMGARFEGELLMVCLGAKGGIWKATAGKVIKDVGVHRFVEINKLVSRVNCGKTVERVPLGTHLLSGPPVDAASCLGLGWKKKVATYLLWALPIVRQSSGEAWLGYGPRVVLVSLIRFFVFFRRKKSTFFSIRPSREALTPRTNTGSN